MKTINVVETIDDGIQSIHAFSDTKIGNKKAEKLFRKLIKEQFQKHNDSENIFDYSEKDYQRMINDGHFRDNWGYGTWLIHSI